MYFQCLPVNQPIRHINTISTSSYIKVYESLLKPNSKVRKREKC